MTYVITFSILLTFCAAVLKGIPISGSLIMLMTLAAVFNLLKGKRMIFKGKMMFKGKKND